MTMKVHLQADDLTPRWVGAVWFDPDGGYPPGWAEHVDGPKVKRTGSFLTRCGQVLSKQLNRNYVTEDLTVATCGSCLHSYGAKHLGLSGRQRYTGPRIVAPVANPYVWDGNGNNNDSGEV